MFNATRLKLNEARAKINGDQHAADAAQDACEGIAIDESQMSRTMPVGKPPANYQRAPIQQMSHIFFASLHIGAEFKPHEKILLRRAYSDLLKIAAIMKSIATNMATVFKTTPPFHREPVHLNPHTIDMLLSLDTILKSEMITFTDTRHVPVPGEHFVYGRLRQGEEDYLMVHTRKMYPMFLKSGATGMPIFIPYLFFDPTLLPLPRASILYKCFCRTRYNINFCNESLSQYAEQDEYSIRMFDHIVKQIADDELSATGSNINENIDLDYISYINNPKI